MTAEALIRRRLVGDAALSAALARHANLPAVFYASPPDDTDGGWNGGAQYPRVEFSVDWRNEPECDTGGTVSVDVVCAATSAASPEQVAKSVKAALSGVFFAPTGAHVFALAWESAQAYQMGALVRQEPLIYGLTLAFRLTAFPERETIDPDPVMGLNRYVRRWSADARLVGDLSGADFFQPTDAHPVVYVRPLNKATDSITNMVVWVNADLALHLFAPGAQARQMWLESFSQRLQLDGEIRLMDGSPMLVKGVKWTATADEASGQLTVSARYGLLRRPRYAHPLMHSYWNDGEPGHVEEHAAPIGSRS